MVILLSCEEEKGICTACCDGSGKTVCVGNMTSKESEEYNRHKRDGLNWTFEIKDICPASPSPN